MKSKNIIFTDKEKIAFVEETLEPMGPDEVLCASEKSLISTGTELFCLKGVFDQGTNWKGWVHYPFHPGYSMAARVTEVGKEVAGLKAGDRIVYNAPHSQFFKFKPLPAYQAQSWVKIPEGVSDEEAPWYGLACTTQLGVRRANLQLGERVGIIGAGLLGQLVTQYLHAFGARKIIVIDPVQMRLDMAKAHGATHTLAADVKQAEGPIREITGGELLDVVFDITGSPVVLPVATTLVRKLGRVILLGDSPTPSQQFLGPRIVSDSISISGIHASMAPSVWSEFNPWTMPEMTALFFEFLLQKRMRVADLITNRYSPKEAPQVYEGLLRDRSSAMGIIFDWKKI